MPRLDREGAASGPVVTALTPDGYRIGDAVFTGGLLLTPEAATPWDAPLLEALTPEAVEAVIALQPRPEFLLLGAGATLRRPPSAFVKALDAQGIGVEPMDSRAAARAWGVLRAEDRWIVAALLPLNG